MADGEVDAQAFRQLHVGQSECQLLRGSALREEGFAVFDRLNPGKLLEEKAQIAIGFEAARLGRFDEAEKGGAGMRSVGMAREEPVFPPDHEGSNGIFGSVVVGCDMTVFHRSRSNRSRVCSSKPRSISIPY